MTTSLSAAHGHALSVPDSAGAVRFVPTSERLSALTAAVAETAEQYDRSGEFPTRGLEAAHRHGVFAAVIGERFGGGGLDAVERLRVLQALGQGDPSVALIFANTVGTHVAQAHADVWPADLYDRVLAETAERPVSINTARAEPELGAPARGGLPATTARRTASGWVVSGRKAYVTASTGLDYHLVWVKTDDPTPRVGHVIVPGGSPGIEIVETWDHLGLRASSTHDVIYRDVEAPVENFLEIPYQGVYRDPAGQGGPLALGHTALYVGVARAAQEFFVRFANERVPAALGRPIATTERIQTVAGEIEAQLVTAETLLYDITARAVAGDETAIARTPLAKVQIVRAAITAVETAVAAIGNPGLTRHNPLQRHLRDVLSARVHPPQEDQALVGAGRRALGV
ncbi:acyl-CoA dehydrogenase family protein [Microbacterium sp. SORGH_AS_0888]|uniref:acyl-CoA dehydrogenase family protein n=1 Tax=Microbacterium sp. SORGH_AS_0888 TaxID=3041791 RepID=UPI002787536E|nr:acyl-CoA dehydrogenase family protein [Microbacterium sp. SORGH_AS_0888]MDQ1130535.1 alkylation response protein AidB-like acyl-CoA dehydrogenase [Microbacterium sp. SORGH_AS_0888]